MTDKLAWENTIDKTTDQTKDGTSQTHRQLGTNR